MLENAETGDEIETLVAGAGAGNIGARITDIADCLGARLVEIEIQQTAESQPCKSRQKDRIPRSSRIQYPAARMSLGHAMP